MDRSCCRCKRTRISISVKPNDSLISSVSVENTKQRPSILVPNGREKALSAVRSYSVLTCLESAVRADVFRPAYCAGDKTIYYANDLRRDLLPELEPVENTANSDLSSGCISAHGWKYAFLI